MGATNGIINLRCPKVSHTRGGTQANHKPTSPQIGTVAPLRQCTAIDTQQLGLRPGTALDLACASPYCEYSPSCRCRSSHSCRARAHASVRSCRSSVLLQLRQLAAPAPRSCSSCTPSSSSRCSLLAIRVHAPRLLPPSTPSPAQAQARGGGGLPGSTTAAATCLHLHLRRRLLPLVAARIGLLLPPLHRPPPLPRPGRPKPYICAAGSNTSVYALTSL